MPSGAAHPRELFADGGEAETVARIHLQLGIDEEEEALPDGIHSRDPLSRGYAIAPSPTAWGRSSRGFEVRIDFPIEVHAHNYVFGQERRGSYEDDRRRRGGW